MSAPLLLAAITADVPAILWGPPGTGKTACVSAMAADAGAHLEVIIGSQIDPVDVGGLPVPTAAGEVHIAAPTWARRIRAALDDGKAAWIFLDELSAAPPAVQAALLRVIHDRTAGELDLRGCRILAAANRADHAADGGVLSAATGNRFFHLEWSGPTPNAWTVGEATGWGRCAPSAAYAAVVAQLGAFLGRFPAALLEPPKAQSVDAWPSPRSWSAAARMVAALPAGLASPLVGEVLAGLVGAGRAHEFIAFSAALDVPDPERLLAGERMPRNLRPDIMGAALLAVAAAAASAHPARASRLARACELLGDVRPDVAVPAAKILHAADPATAEFSGMAALLKRLQGAL